MLFAKDADFIRMIPLLNSVRPDILDDTMDEIDPLLTGDSGDVYQAKRVVRSDALVLLISQLNGDDKAGTDGLN